MARRYTRMQVLERVKKELTAARPLLIASAGAGIIAKYVEIAGTDFIVVGAPPVFRMDGHGSLAGVLPMANNNDLVIQWGPRHVLPIVREVPVLALLMGNDKSMDMQYCLEEMKRVGYSGIMDFPLPSFIGGEWEKACEATGVGFECELQAVRLARELDLFTVSYVFQREHAARMAAEGVDVLIPHMGVTMGGSITELKSPYSLEAAARKTQDFIDSAKARSINPEMIFGCHGGPISSPADVQYVFDHTDAVLFVAGSSIERIAIEEAIPKATQNLKNLSIQRQK